MHTLETIGASHIILVLDQMDNTIAWMNYGYVTKDYEPHPDGEIAFVDSVIMTETHRGSRLFVKGFHYLVNHINEENRHVRTFQFYALADNTYLTKLYSKFADIIGQRDGYHGRENIFSADFPRLLRYLNRAQK
ncbi:GNAT family N-acetyltransferase [Aneurinibacillus soli]|nr:GNAT family N-acetyltransferase [Aneurinibacillus soli]